MRFGRWGFEVGLVALLVATGTLSIAQSQTNVTLSSASSPSTGQAGIHNISVTGSGFPTGTIAPADVLVTVEPASSGGGASGSTSASAVATVIGTTRRVTFQIPSAIAVVAPTAYLVSIAGRTATGVTFASTTKATLTVNPPPAIVSLSPATLPPGTGGAIAITTQYTNFVQGATMASFGPNATVGGAAAGALAVVTVTSPTTATAQVAIGASAPAGFQTVTVKTGVQQASTGSQFSVPAPAPINRAPVVTAGAAQTITLPATANLSGSATDDGLPASSAVTASWTKVSGPGIVTFGNAASVTTSASFDQAGTYVLRLTATDSLLTTSAEVSITVNPANTAPVVSAGAAQTITLPGGVSLAGSVSDDGLPAGASITATWSKVSGAGAVSFANVNSPTTTATFDTADTYVLRLSATDTQLSAASDVTIVVNPVPRTNLAPVVSAGTGQTVTLPAMANLSGSATDDGLPAGAPVTSAWSKFSGPGIVTFANGASPTTTAVFGQPGTYVVRLAASDTLLSAFADVTITVNPVPPTNQSPTVNAGANATITLPSGTSLNGVVNDDGLPAAATVTSVWSKFSGPGIVTFANGASPTTTAVFGQPGTYVLRLTASDTVLSAFADVTITVNPAPPTNQAPVVNPGANATITLPASAALTGVVTDDGLPAAAAVTSAWTKVSGPGSVVFANPASAVTTAAFNQAGTYVLRLTASDTLLSVFGDVTITANNPVPTNAVPIARPGGPYAGATGAPIAFNGSLSSDPDLDPLSFVWSFGDGSSGSSPQPSHTYATADQFTVTLTVSDGKGGSHSAVSIASVAQTNRPPTASVGGPFRGDAGSPIGFNGSASDPDQDALTLAWDYGDGSQGSGQAPSHVYVSQGTYAVTLTVSDGHGGTTTAASSAIVGPVADRAPPVVKLSAPTTALPGTETIVTADAADNVGIADVSFDVEGAPSSQVATAPYRRTVDIPALAAPGTTIKVKATARDAANNAGTDQATITIVAAPDTTPPTVSIQLPPQASPGTTIAVSASAADAGGVQLVSFSSAGVPFATDGASPYSVLFVVPADAVPGTTLSFAARATDFANNVAESSGQVPIVATSDTQPPTVALTAPETIVAGATVHLTAGAADNVQVASVDFLIDDVVVGSAIAPPFKADAASSRPAGAVLRVRARARDSSGNQAVSDRETRVVSPAATGAAVLTGKVYDDTTGLLLPGALVTLAGSDGNGQPYTATATSDDRGAFYLNASSGHGTLRITRAGWTRVDRPVDVPASQALRVVDARLTPVAAAAPAVPAIVGGTVQAGDALLAIAAGGLAVDTALRVTSVGQQGLEGPLPVGWSPAGIVDVTPHGVEFTAPQALSLANRLKLPAGTNVVVVAWDEAASAWRAVGVTAIAGDGSRLAAAIGSSGQFAWLIADTLPARPPVPGNGALVDGVGRGVVPDPASIRITPQPRVIFYKPGVNSHVGAVLDAPLPSGTPLRARVVESYTFTSSDAARPDPFVEDLVFYQRPGPGSTVSASFIVTPSLTFDPVDLRQGVITVELAVPSDVNSQPVVGAEGGVIGTPTGEALQVPAGAFSTNVPIGIESFTLEALGVALPPELSFIGGASVAFSAGTPVSPAVLTIPRPPQVDGSSPIVLLRLALIEGRTRLLMVGIGRVVGTRIVSDVVVPGAAAILDGVSTPGRYLFVRGTSALTFATGTVTGANGLPLARALVTASGLPIVALSDVLGRYVVPVGVGAVAITAKDLQKQDTQTIQRTVAAGTVVSADVPLSVLSLTVTSLTPTEGATSVALSVAVVATFSAPIDPATLAGPSGSSIVVKTSGGAVIGGMVSLSAGNTKATFRPSSLLAPNGSFTATVSTEVKDLAGRSLSAGAVTHFASLDTTPPVAPPAGSITATIPDANGFTTVTATQGSAGVHDTVSIVNKTKKTSFPALVAANGAFAATLAVALGDALQVAITDQSGNQTVVALPPFTRTNADGSRATVVGSLGGHLTGPGGTAVDVPAGALPDGTIITIKTIDEASFPTKLTADQKAFFTFSGGIQLDFGGATPSQYLNVSLPPAGGETRDDRWIVGQVVDVGGQPTLNVVDTARIIAGRITTSSPPCPGVQAAAAYGFIKSAKRFVGVNYGRFTPPETFSSRMLSFAQPLFGAGASMVSLPFGLLASPASTDICIPILSGRVTVQPNSQKIVLSPVVFTPGDREIVVRNEKLAREFHYPRHVAEYRFLVDGSADDTYQVAIVTAGAEQPAAFTIGSASSGFVNIRLTMEKLNASFSEVVVRNLSRNPRIESRFPQNVPAVKLPVPGGASDGFTVTAVDTAGNARAINFAVESPAGAGNLVATAIPVTIDPNTDVFLVRLTPMPAGVPEVVLSRVNITNAVEGGGFTYVFDGNAATDAFRVEVVYKDGRPTDSITIPNVLITESNPATGRIIRTFAELVPPPDEPYNLGLIDGDTTAPILTASPALLNNFDPAGFLAFTFSEGIARASTKDGLYLLDSSGVRIPGEMRLDNGNRTVTFVPKAPLKMGARYTVRLEGLADGSGNKVRSTSMTVTVFSPRLVTAPYTAAGTLKMLRYLTLVQKPGTGGAPDRTLGFGVIGDVVGYARRQAVIFDLTDAQAPVLLATIPTDDFQRLTVVQNVQSLPTQGTSPCGGATSFSGDLLITSSYTDVGSAVRFYDVTNPAAPCMLGAKALTLNPSFASYPAGVVVASPAFARGVAVLPSGNRLNSYTAVGNVGIMRVDVGAHIPPVPADRRTREPMVAGDYTDVIAAGGRLLSVERTVASLDVFDANLAQLSTTSLGLQEAIALAYAEGVPFDANKDGQIGQDEVLNLAFVGGSGGVAIVNVTDLSAPTVLGTVPFSGVVYQLEFDAVKRRLFASGLSALPNGEFIVSLIDLGGASPFASIDADNDGRDDRITWRTPAGAYGLGSSNYRALRFDPLTRNLYVGLTTTAEGVGGFDLWKFDNVCCDLSTDVLRNIATPSALGGGGDKADLLRRERDALVKGMSAGLTSALAKCSAVQVSIDPAKPAVKGTPFLAILEQGSGACMWRKDPRDPSGTPLCGKAYQPGLSDHDYEVFMPASYFVGSVGSRPADCVVGALSEQFTDPSTDEPKPIEIDGSQVRFDDITFFPFGKEGFDGAQLDILPPQNATGDTLGDLAMGRQQLLLLWLLGGEYVTLSSFNVAGEPLDSIMETFRTTTKIPRLEGYEWANLQRFNLLKSKAFIRIAGALQPESQFHDMFVKQLHDAAKAGIRTAFARLVADPEANKLLLDVRRTNTSPGTGPSYRSNACATFITSDPSTWQFTKNCEGFEEYVVAVAARSVKAGLTIFTAEEVFNKIDEFWRVKADVEHVPRDITSEGDADRFIAEVANFIGGADVPDDVDAVGGVVAATKGVYETNPDANAGRAAQRAKNLEKVKEKISAASKNISLHVVPHVSNRGFVAASQVELSMYRGQGSANGVRVATVAPTDPNKPLDPLRVDLGANDDRYLATGADVLPAFEVEGATPEERNLNDLSKLDANRKKPIFALGDPRLKKDKSGNAAPGADPNNPLLDLKPSPIKWVAFTIDLPDTPSKSKQKEADRQNNFNGFFYYMLDRTFQVTPAPGKVPFPGMDPTVLQPNGECTASTEFDVTQNVTIGGQTFEGEAPIGPGETATLNFTVTSRTLKPLTSVSVCSELTHQCYPIGTVVGGTPGKATATLTAPNDPAILEGIVTAITKEAGAKSGPSLRLNVSCQNFGLVPLDPDPNPTASLDPNASPVEQGGKAIRYYRVIDHHTGLPMPNVSVKALLEIPGRAPQVLEFLTDATGLVVSPDIAGMAIAYPAGVPPGTTMTVRITEINGTSATCLVDPTFGVSLKERSFSSILKGGASLQLEGKFEGINFVDKGGFGISESVNSTPSGNKELVFGRTLANSIKAGAKYADKRQVDLVVEGSALHVEAAAFGNNLVMTQDEHRYPLPLSTDDAIAVAALAGTSLFTAPLSLLPAGPVLTRILNEVFERATGLDSNRTSVGMSAALGAEANGAAKLVDLTLGKSSAVNPKITTGLGVKVAASGAADAAIVLSIDILPRESPALLKAGIDYRGAVNWSAGVTGSLSSELAKPQADSGLTRDEILLKLAKTLDFVKDLLNTTGGFAGSIKFTVTVDAENVKLKSATVSISQKKQYGFKILGSSIVDQGDGNMRTMTFRMTDRDPEKLQKAVEQMAIVQAALGLTALAGPILAPPPQIAPDFLTDQIVKLISYADEYEKVLETGKGISFPIGLSKLLKGTPLVKSDKPGAGSPPVEDFAAEAALNFDSATSYVTERGVIRRGGMFALERYPDPDPLAPVSGDLAVSFLNDAKKVLETITDNYQSIKTVIGKATAVLDKRFSPSGVTLEIDGAAEPDGPDPFEVGLFAFPYTPVPGPLVPTVQSPEDVGGAVERPHYGVGGFFQFTPAGRTLAAPAKLTIHYLDTETAGLDERSFAIYRWNQHTLDWDLIGGVVDPVNHNVSTTISVLGLFTVAPRMPSGRIAFTVQVAAPVDPQMPTTATFTSGVITLNSGGIVPDGTPFTVVTSAPDALTLSRLGTITSTDADPLTDGAQVVSQGGVIRFTVTLPAGVTAPRVVGFATRGTAFGSQVVPLQ